MQVHTNQTRYGRQVVPRGRDDNLESAYLPTHREAQTDPQAVAGEGGTSNFTIVVSQRRS